MHLNAFKLIKWKLIVGWDTVEAQRMADVLSRWIIKSFSENNPEEGLEG